MTPTAAFELTPVTEPGRRLSALATDLAAQLGKPAAANDRTAGFPFAGAQALRHAGVYGAPVPEPLGGMGVESVHDLVVAASRLAQGDPALTVGLNMHLATVANIARHWRRLEAAGETRHAETVAAALAAIARERAVIATAISEPRQDITRPSTRARRNGDGWQLDGRKIFATGSPAATLLYVAVTYAAAGGVERYGFAHVPAGAPGVVLHDDWDALGMRASGSQSVSFEGVQLPAAALRGGFPAGDARAYMEVYGSAGLFHASASLGIAEAAGAGAVAAARRFGVAGARGRMLLAENAVDLSAARATLSRAALLLDGPGADPVALFGEAQAAKAFVGQAAERVVNRALELSGGAGYLNGHPLARAYRDVKASAFMHPLGANRAYDLLADLALGHEPELH
jgi:alkylation response protein AidB-like acyl-CoA dehydrogenase